MSDWADADKVAKDDKGNYQALIGGQWKPVAKVAKNEAGKYVAYVGGEAAPAPSTGSGADLIPGAPSSNPDSVYYVPPRQPEPTTANESYFDRFIRGPSEAATALAVAPVAALAGGAAESGSKLNQALGMKGKLTPEEVGDKLTKALTWMPRTKAGQIQLKQIAEALGSSEILRNLQAVPGLSGELNALSRGIGPAAQAAKTVAAGTAPKALEALKAGGTAANEAISSRIPGVNLSRATKQFGESTRGLPAEMAAKAEADAARQGIDLEAKATQEATRLGQSGRLAESGAAELEKSAYQTGKDAEARAGEILKHHLGEPKTPEQVGAPMQERLGGKMKAAYEERSAAAKTAYNEAEQAALKLESAGNGFAQSPHGQGLVADLQAMKSPGPGGYSKLTEEQSAAIDKLIATIEGRTVEKSAPLGAGKVSSKLKTSTSEEKRAPAAFQALQARLRELRKVDERPGAPVEGFAALGRDFAHELAGKMENRIYAWNPSYKAADEQYKALSRALDVFETEGMSSALRGEKFDYKKLAASPSEFAPKFFKDGQSVRQLKAATGDPEMVKAAAKEWASSQLRGKTAEQAKEWAVKNADWLSEAGVTGPVQQHLADLTRHEAETSATLARMKTRQAGMTKEASEALKGVESVAKELASARGDVVKTQAKRTEMSGKIEKLLQRTDAKRLQNVFVDDIEPALRESGVMSDADISKLAKQVQQIDKASKSTEKAKKIATAIAVGMGVYQGAKVLGSVF